MSLICDVFILWIQKQEEEYAKNKTKRREREGSKHLSQKNKHNSAAYSDFLHLNKDYYMK